MKKEEETGEKAERKREREREREKGGERERERRKGTGRAFEAGANHDEGATVDALPAYGQLDGQAGSVVDAE